jgi:phosphoenolpyruvate carboxykinase (ATP)
VFLVWHPTKYAEMLGQLLKEHGSSVWLVNTGWSGGAYGTGKRMKLPYTRAMVRAALSGELDKVPVSVDPVFGLSVPTSVTDVPSEILDPRGTWPDPAAYDEQAKKLAGMFRANFEKFGDTSAEIREAGPKG